MYNNIKESSEFNKLGLPHVLGVSIALKGYNKTIFILIFFYKKLSIYCMKIIQNTELRCPFWNGIEPPFGPIAWLLLTFKGTLRNCKMTINIFLGPSPQFHLRVG